jgi:hypothetical protein
MAATAQILAAPAVAYPGVPESAGKDAAAGRIAAVTTVRLGRLG